MRQALIIEDEPHLVDIFGRVLSLVDFQVENFSTGDCAIDYLRISRPQLVLLDLNLPRVSGIDVLRQIRSDERLVDTKVIVVTADTENARRVDNPVDAILIKPVGVNQLKDAIFQLFPELDK